MQKHTVYFVLLISLLFASFRPASAALFPRLGHRAVEEDMADMVAVEAPADTLDKLLEEMIDLRLRADSLQHLLDGMELSAIAEEQAAAERVAVDTLPTDDKFVKIVLYSDNTWQYVDYGRPVINDEFFGDHWDNENIHAYRDVTLKDIPDEVDILLVDSLHHAVAPFVGRVNSKYAFRSNVGREHQGTDIKLNTGDPVMAAFDGKVRIVASSSLTGGYGNLVVIRHPNGLETYYAHLSKVLVKENDLVAAGEVIAYGGSTGRSTGPHLHFETRYLGQTFDPERIFDFTTGVLQDTILTLHKHYFSIYSHNSQSDSESLAASQRIVHTIRSGDTLGALARRYQTTVSAICRLNGIKSTTILRVGRRLIVR
ncbi:MAG: peptidoglycan DD-metalloendopeptidase family protein [Bacteroidales bacterium]|nr:peptidoglycan DD-metalloendopeptidase family protein [Bacteroidales bacterium]